jgi:WD40 repeat protein
VSRSLRLQAGGTLNPRRHIYITRPEDDHLYNLLREGYYVNVLSSRQMGKSSLMVRTAERLEHDGSRAVIIDLAGELGGALDRIESYYLGLLGRIRRDLNLSLDLEAWWGSCGTETWNQRLLGFFREVVCWQLEGRVVVFLDEIDSTLKLPYTDDLFTAIRSMYNQRPQTPDFERVSFCLIGVATANELIKDRRTTPYNIGETLELDDFQAGRDDLTELAQFLHEDESQGRALLGQVLRWTGGHPYLTAKVCTDLKAAGIATPAEVDRQVEEQYASLERVRNDAHFQSMLRFVAERLTSGLTALNLYQKIHRGVRERDVPGVAQNELKLSGLVRRDDAGCLVVRNPIYRRVFDQKWVASLSQLRQRALNRGAALGLLLILLVVLVYVLVESSSIEGTMVLSAAFSPDGKKVVTASLDGTARVWITSSGQQTAVLRGHEHPVSFAAFSPDGKRVVTASESDWTAPARVWDAGSGRQTAVLQGQTDQEADAALRAERIVFPGHKAARLWDVATGRQTAILRGLRGWVELAAFSPDGRRIVTAPGKKSAAFSPDGQRVVTVSEEETRFGGTTSKETLARLWDTGSGKETAVLRGHTDRVESVAFCPDGKRVVTASRDRTARVWDADTGREMVKLAGHKLNVESAAFSPDGKRVVTASSDHTARVWDADTGQETAVLAGHSEYLFSAVFSPDGKRVLTASYDKTARIWDAGSGKEQAVLRAHTGIVVSAAFSPDGRKVVTASHDGTARVWETERGRPLKTLRHLAAIQTVAWQVKQTDWHRYSLWLTLVATVLCLQVLVLQDVIDSDLATSGARVAWAMAVGLLPFLGIPGWLLVGRRRAGGRVAGARKV